MENIKELNDLLVSGVINGDFDKISNALEGGADLHTKTTKGNNLLYIAATRMQEDVFNELIEVEVSGKKIDLNEQNNMGYTTLLEMVRENNCEQYVKSLLEHGANPNIVANDGVSPLVLACADKKNDCVKLLIDGGAQLDYKVPGTGTTAFLMAASQSSMDICSLLKEAGADVNVVDSFGKNALLTAIFKSDQFMKKKEKIEHRELCFFLSDIGIDINYVAPSGMTALWAASMNRDAELVKHLLQKGAKADVWHEIGLEGKMSALHIWMNSGDPEIVKLLIDNGAKLSEIDSNGNTPDAIGFMNPALKELMLEINADVNSIYNVPKTSKSEITTSIPVITNIISGGNNNNDFVKEMINRGANTSYAGTELEAFDPLLAAITASAYDIVETIVKNNPKGVNHLFKLNQNAPAISPLSLNISGGLNNKLSSFLNKKAQLELLVKAKEVNDKNGVKSEIINDDGFKQIEDELSQINSLEATIKEQRKSIFNSLIKAGADVNLKDENGHSPIFFANDEFSVGLLKSSGADLFAKDNSGNNPFVYSIQNNKKELTSALLPIYKDKIQDIFYQLAFTDIETSYSQQLLESGIISFVSPSEDFLKSKDAVINVEGINYKDEDGNTPILVACSNNLPFLVSLYYRLGADVNLANSNGETPLMHAIASENVQVVDFLIKNGSSVNDVTIEGKSVKDFAEESGNLEILESVKLALGEIKVEGSISGLKKLKR